MIWEKNSLKSQSLSPVLPFGSKGLEQWLSTAGASLPPSPKWQPVVFRDTLVAASRRVGLDSREQSQECCLDSLQCGGLSHKCSAPNIEKSWPFRCMEPYWVLLDKELWRKKAPAVLKHGGLHCLLYRTENRGFQCGKDLRTYSCPILCS